MDQQIADKQKFWIGCMTSLSNHAKTPITELKKMDVMDFFALLSIVEEKDK